MSDKEIRKADDAKARRLRARIGQCRHEDLERVGSNEVYCFSCRKLWNWRTGKEVKL